jgi:iron(III) transport system substrate-binding protein
MHKLLSAILFVLSAAGVWAGEQDLLQRARSEGRASFYANITAVEPIIKAFTADTGVKGEYTRISTTKFVATAITEFEAGKFMADVVQGPLPVLEMLRDRGMLA